MGQTKTDLEGDNIIKRGPLSGCLSNCKQASSVVACNWSMFRVDKKAVKSSSKSVHGANNK
jgi:hypothetical protein